MSRDMSYFVSKIPDHSALFILFLQGRKRIVIPRIGCCKRFLVANMRNVMSGILLASGPVSTRVTVKNLSSAFNLAVTKTKFLSAAKQLEEANIGHLILLKELSLKAHFFVKRQPDEVRDILLQPCNQDLCTFQEYEQRFFSPSPSTITPKMQQTLVAQGFVPPGLFSQQRPAPQQPVVPQSLPQLQ